MTIRPKAIFVGPKQIGDHLAKLMIEWNFIQVENIVKLWEGLSSHSIDDDVQAIITLDGFFKPQDPSDTSFEQLIATMYPYCLFLVISYKPELETQIRSRVAAESSALGNSEGEEFYFISPRQPKVDIEKAIAHYVTHTENEDVAAILAGQEVEEQKHIEEEFNPASHAAKYDFDEIESDTLGQVLAITSSKGGSGKSTVTTTLATYLAHSSINSVKEGREDRPLKVVILDLDVRDGQIGFLTGNMSPTILHMRSNQISEKTLSETIIHNERLKVDLLLAPKRPRVADDTPPEFYLELIQFLKKFYDYILLDTSVNYLDPLLEKVAYPIADQIIFVSDIVVTSVYSMTRWIQEVTKPKHQNGMGIDRMKIGIVVNKSMNDINMTGVRISKSALGLPILTVIPNNAKLLAHATNMQSMETILKHSGIRTSLRLLAKKIVGKKYYLSDNVE